MPTSAKIFTAENSKNRGGSSICTCQEKVDTKKAKLQKAQFGFVLNWAFVAQGSSGAKIIIEINIAIQQIRKILSILKSEVEI